MTIEEIVKYVLHTPYNTNRAILTSMLEQLIADNNGSDVPDGPGTGNDNIIYDGGFEG